ncbi:hypothetical protein AAFF_G00023630 [Aldrovandia affinis]|uniref:Uncharacterized protein n=1 Tax=Aldrovandia affinis TaxID=143900 RepID=A0AAD7WZK9_9TELE|nr:hypothetical protein AAFF_G00023630 [Aldrovandia affinis]
MGLNQQLFLLRTESLNTAGLTDFYGAVLRAWQLLRPCREGGLERGPWLWKQPIFHNPLIESEPLGSVTLQGWFIAAAVCRLAHLQQPGGSVLVTPQELDGLMGVHSLRLLEGVLGDVRQALPGPSVGHCVAQLKGIVTIGQIDRSVCMDRKLTVFAFSSKAVNDKLLTAIASIPSPVSSGDCHVILPSEEPVTEGSAAHLGMRFFLLPVASWSCGSYKTVKLR